MKLSLLINKISKYYHQGGVLWLCKRVIIKAVSPFCQYYEGMFFEKHLNKRDSNVSLKLDNTEISLLNEGDIETLKKIRQHPDEKFAHKRLKNNQLCFIVKYKSELCFYVWAAYGERIVLGKKLVKDIHIKRKEVFIYDGYTLPKFRGRNIYPFMMNYISAYFRSKGYDRLVGIVYGYNIASIKGIKKACFTLYEINRYFKFVFLKKIFCITKNIR